VLTSNSNQGGVILLWVEKIDPGTEQKVQKHSLRHINYRVFFKSDLRCKINDKMHTSVGEVNEF
jgi:hypothetical protein